MSRAIRRHHRERLKLVRSNYHIGKFPRYQNDPKQIAIWIDTPKPCSCNGCGNQRHAFGRDDPSIQERRSISLDFQECDYD